MEKIKAFFQNKITKIVAWLVLALDIVVLFLGTAGLLFLQINAPYKLVRLI